MRKKWIEIVPSPFHQLLKNLLVHPPLLCIKITVGQNFQKSSEIYSLTNTKDTLTMSSMTYCLLFGPQLQVTANQIDSSFI